MLGVPQQNRPGAQTSVCATGPMFPVPPSNGSPTPRADDASFGLVPDKTRSGSLPVSAPPPPLTGGLTRDLSNLLLPKRGPQRTEFLAQYRARPETRQPPCVRFLFVRLPFAPTPSV